MPYGGAGHAALDVEHLTVRSEDRILLQDIDFFVREKSCLVITGESGSGKSVLLNHLAGLGSRCTQQGEIRWLGRPVSSSHAPPLVRRSCGMLMASAFDALLEHIRLQENRSREEWTHWLHDQMLLWGFPELEQLWHLPVMNLSPLHQRVIAILRESFRRPPLLLIDDLTRGLNEYDRFVLLDFVRSLSREMAIVIVIGTPRESRLLGGQHIVLHAGRMIQTGTEDATWTEDETGVFLPDDIAPVTPHPASYQRPQSTQTNEEAWAFLLDELDPRPDEPPLSRPAELDDGFVPANHGPRGFYWVVDGRLAGTPMPGLVYRIHHDLSALKRCQVTTLLNLSQTEVDPLALSAHGLESHWLDDDPTLAQLRMLAVLIDRLLAEGEVVAVHCVSGNRRTGLVLCAYLIHAGQSLAAAIARVQAANPSFHPPEQHLSLLRDMAHCCPTA